MTVTDGVKVLGMGNPLQVYLVAGGESVHLTSGLLQSRLIRQQSADP